MTRKYLDCFMDACPGIRCVVAPYLSLPIVLFQPPACPALTSQDDRAWGRQPYGSFEPQIRSASSTHAGFVIKDRGEILTALILRIKPTAVSDRTNVIVPNRQATIPQNAPILT
jgi:hypothetical protein